jgi:hypothetical protein
MACTTNPSGSTSQARVQLGDPLKLFNYFPIMKGYFFLVAGQKAVTTNLLIECHVLVNIGSTL